MGAAHYVRSSGDNRTTLSFEVTFYRAVPWPDVSLSTGVLHLPPHGQATFEATAQVPSDATYGLQSGSIVVTDPGRLDIDPAYQPRQSTIPIAWQVWPDVAAGAVLTDQVGGGFGWQGRGEEGGCHFY